jgi:hypothetical protein
MAVSRSPNYPFLTLGEALDAIRPVLKAEHRNKMSRQVLAAHLGYSSISGRALAKMGALKAYGLVEGVGDDTRVSADALICVEAPEDDPERLDALRRCAMKPTIFREIAREFETLPSDHNLRFWLIKRGYTPDAAGKAVQTYLATMRLVGDSGAIYNPLPTEDEMDTSTETARAETAARAPATRAAEFPAPVGTRRFVVNLPDGDAVLTYPAEMSSAGFQDLKDYLDLFLKKALREQETGSAPGIKPTGG